MYGKTRCMIWQMKLTLPAFGRGFHLITRQVEEAIEEWPQQGLLNVFLQHTSAGITINENADPSVREDFEPSFNHLVPERQRYYTHTAEGPDDMPAHIKSALIGQSLMVPIRDGRLAFGTWQGIYLCEFRNRGGKRNLLLTVYS